MKAVRHSTPSNHSKHWSQTQIQTVPTRRLTLLAQAPTHRVRVPNSTNLLYTRCKRKIDSMPKNPQLLSISQAAARLSISVQTLRAYADRGLVPVVRLPSGYRRFEPAAIEAVLREMGMVTGAAAESDQEESHS